MLLFALRDDNFDLSSISREEDHLGGEFGMLSRSLSISVLGALQFSLPVACLLYKMPSSSSLLGFFSVGVGERDGARKKGDSSVEIFVRPSGTKQMDDNNGLIWVFRSRRRPRSVRTRWFITVVAHLTSRPREGALQH